MTRSLLVSAALLLAQAQGPSSFTLDQVLAYPFPDNLTAAAKGSTIAWTFNERGARNIYVADGPEFKARRVTPYVGDEGQEITSVHFTPDGKSIVYVRGGDHGANWPAEGNLAPDPNSSPVQPKIQIFIVSITGQSMPKLIGDGDDPAISPAGNRVAFVRDRKIFLAPIDGSKPAEQAFFVRGAAGAPVWDDTGNRLAFVNDRDDHSFIGIFTDSTQPLKYLATSTSRDSQPVWSLDAGREILFVRQPGRGGTPQSPLVQQPSPWSIMVVNALELPPGKEPPPPFRSWQSGTKLVDSIPRFAGGTNLRWAADDHIIFTSYQDGWPHLYSIQHPGEGGKPKLLTPGEFMVEHVTLTPDGKSVIYSANTGAAANDIDRRHIFKVPVDGSTAPQPITGGTTLEWSPVVTGDGQTLAFLQSTPQRPALPAVMPMSGGQARAIGTERLPASFPQTQLITPEPIEYKSPDGVAIHGQLFKGRTGNARRPALVYVHGGPQRQMLLGFHYMDYYSNDYAANQYLASRGFVVLAINYRLGIGYGHAFHFPENAGQRGASEYQDVLAAAKLLQARADVDPSRIGIWGGSYGGYLTALALGRNSDIFAAGVDIHGVHNWDRQGRAAPDMKSAMAEDGITEADLKKVAKVTYESSPVSSVKTWRSPVILIHGDDDRNVEFHQTVDLEQRLLEKGVHVESLVIPDDIHDFLRFQSWKTATTAAGEFLERQLLRPRTNSQQ